LTAKSNALFYVDFDYLTAGMYIAVFLSLWRYWSHCFCISCDYSV